MTTAYADGALGALDGEDEEDLFAYNYGEDFPEAFTIMGTAMLGGRPVNRGLGPVQQVKILSTAAEFRAATPRKPGKGKPLPASEAEGEQETKARKDAQKSCRRLIIPKPKHEPSDAFIRRLDAHRNAPEALIVPMTPPEDETQFVKRMVAVKETVDTPDVLIFPKGPKETNAEFEERLSAAKKVAVIIFPRGKFESNPNWKLRLAAQMKSKRPILPKAEEEGDRGFKERCEYQPSCAKVMHPYDPKREDTDGYHRRLEANKEKTGVSFEPGDIKAVDAILGKPKKVELNDAHFGEEHHVDAKAELKRELSDARHIHEAEEKSAKALDEEARKEEEEEHAKELEEERVAARLAEMKLKQEEERKKKEEEEAKAAASFGMEKVEISKVGFMPLKKLLMERGVPKEQVFACANKFALIEVAKKWGPELKIEFVDAVDVS